MRRLYRAVCSLVEAKTRQLNEPEPELQPEGAYTDHERGEDLLPHELHAANMHDSIDNDYGATIGFTQRMHDE